MSNALVRCPHWATVIHAGVALSVAPLLGSSAYVDQAHPKWLHLHVRPHARGLAKTVRVSEIKLLLLRLKQAPCIL